MNEVVFSLMMLGAMSGAEGLPFWATANNYGLMPDFCNVLLVADAHREYEPARTFQLDWGISGAGVQERGHAMTFLPDQLYGGFRWKTISLDVGMMHRERLFLASDPALGSLSMTEGHMIENNNARTIPGALITLRPTDLPWTNGKLKLSGAFGDYRTRDQRYVQGTLIHRTKLFLTYAPSSSFELTAGLDHFCQWGGTHPEYGRMEITAGNYFRMITGRSAGSEGAQMDRHNVIGNQGGEELLRMLWRTDKGDITFQWEKPYDDKSGMVIWNFPDGNYTLAWEGKEDSRWISGAALEFQYTKWQSGSVHDREDDGNGNQIIWHPGLNFIGGDNYFNNGYYRSGWTHFGRSIGNPMFTVGKMGITNNRVRVFHSGITGYLFRNKKAPYKLMLTYRQNFGTYTAPLKGEGTWQKEWKWWQKNAYDVAVPQFSAAFTGFACDLMNVKGLSLTYGLYADMGELLGNRFGATLGIRYTLGTGCSFK